MDKREKLLRKIYEKKRLFSALGAFSSAVSAAFVLLYCSLLLFLLIEGEHLELLKRALTAGVPFFAVGLARRIIKAQRPYEIYDFYEESPKTGLFGLIKSGERERGNSFPSRHAYSSFVIATIGFFVCPFAGMILYAVGAAMCAARVLLGIHFIRDVLCGAAIGVAAGILGEFLLNF